MLYELKNLEKQPYRKLATEGAVVKKPQVLRLSKYPIGHANVQMQGAQNTEPRGV
jgi:hypothetical protein